MTNEEAFILDYWAKKPINFQVPLSFNQEFGGRVDSLLKVFLDGGYLQIVYPKDSLPFHTVPELKDVLRSKKVLLSGKKQDLIERIIENFSEDELVQQGILPVLSLTAIGKAVVRQKKILFLNEKHGYGFSDAEILEHKNELLEINSAFTDCDVFWSLFNDRKDVASRRGDWKTFKKILCHMGDILFQEERYDGVIPFYCAALYIDLSGMVDAKAITPFEQLSIDDSVLQKLKETLSKALMRIENFEEFFFIAIERTLSPKPSFSYFDEKTICRIIMDMLDGGEFASVRDSYAHVSPPTVERSKPTAPTGEEPKKGFMSKLFGR